MERPEFPTLFDRLYRAHYAIGNFLWFLAVLQRWTHYFMPTGHDRTCTKNWKPLEDCLCWGGVDLRTKQMSPEGRFYLKTHLAVWLFGVRWYDFWRYKYYAWTAFHDTLERLLVPSRWQCEYCSQPWGKHAPTCTMLEVPDGVYDNYEDPMYDDYPYDEPEPLDPSLDDHGAPDSESFNYA